MNDAILPWKREPMSKTTPQSGDAIAWTSSALNDATDIKSSRRSAHQGTQLLRDLIFILTWRDVKIKYKQSIMGFMWAILMPAIIVGAGMLVRVAMSKVSGNPLTLDHLASMAVKAVPWAFFVSAIRFATNSLTGNMNLVTKINCPRIAFPASAILSSLFDLLIATIPLTAVLAWCGIMFSFELLWVPLLLALLILLVSGIGIALAAANLYYRDVKYIVEVILTFAIFFTPVLYEADMLGEWRFWILLNPIAPLLEGLRSAVVLQSPPDLGWLTYSAVVSVLVFAGSWRLFRRLEPTFADNI
jgi:lipopolysaccharide transport system permease protein